MPLVEGSSPTASTWQAAGVACTIACSSIGIGVSMSVNWPLVALVLSMAAAVDGARSHYDVLGLRRDADADAVRRAYKQAALRHHPDRGGTNEKFEEVNEAFSVLSDARRRQQYDAQQRFGGAAPSGASGRPVLRVPLPCTLREFGGWMPVPLVLALAHAGLHPHDALRLGVPVQDFLPPGSAAGDTFRIALPAADLIFELLELPHRRFVRLGDTLEAEVWLPAWHNLRKPPIRMCTICGKRVRVRARGHSVSPRGNTVRLAGLGMPRHGGSWSSPVTATRGDLLVRFRLRSMRESLVGAALRTAGIALAVRALMLQVRPRKGHGSAQQHRAPMGPIDKVLSRAIPTLGRFGKVALFGW